MKNLLFTVIIASTLFSCKNKPETETPKILFEEVSGYSFDYQPTLDSIDYGQEMLNKMNLISENIAEQKGDSTYVAYKDADKIDQKKPETKQKAVMVISTDSIFQKMLSNTESTMFKNNSKTKIDFKKEFIVLVSDQPSQVCQCFTSTSLIDLYIKNETLFGNISQFSTSTEFGTTSWQVKIFKFKKDKLKNVQLLYNNEQLDFKL